MAVRFLAGAGLGAAMPILITLASEAVTPANRGRAVGWMYCGMPVGAAILSLIAATEFGANWKNIFYLGGLLPIIVIPVMMFLLPESKEYLKAKDLAEKMHLLMLRLKVRLKTCLTHKTCYVPCSSG